VQMDKCSAPGGPVTICLNPKVLGKLQEEQERGVVRGLLVRILYDVVSVPLYMWLHNDTLSKVELKNPGANPPSLGSTCTWQCLGHLGSLTPPLSL
jgi:hypothetical protein